jgi:hypothetical protein
MRASLAVVTALAVSAASTAADGQQAAAPREDGTLVYASVQNSGNDRQVGGNYAAMQFSDDASSSFYGCYKNRNTDKRKGGTIVRAGDDLCEIQANGWDGSTYNTSGTINFSVDDAPSRGTLPTSFAVWLGGTGGSGISRNHLGLLIDSRANAYFRNGNVGIGSIFGYDPPATYDKSHAPPFPLTIGAQQSGTSFAAFKAGSTAGGARINVSEGHSSIDPVYGFWGDADTGIGNPEPGVVNVYAAGHEVARIARDGAMHVAGAADVDAVRLRPAMFAALPACDDRHAGTMAYITDAPTPITAWHQPVRSGGGRYRAFISCNGEEWHAFDG